MREDWPTRRLGELSDIAYGYTEKAVTEPIGPKFLRITDIQNDTVDWDAVPHCKIDDSDNEKHKLVTGDIVFARTGATTGKSYMVSEPPDAVCASYLIRLRLQSSQLLPKFVSFYFSTKAYWDAISTGISGSAQGGFNASKLGALQIPLPPLSEQQRIVAFLEETFAGLATATANAEKNLKNARKLFESYREAIFDAGGEGWTECALGELVEIKHGFAFESKYFRPAGDYVLLTPGNFFEEGGYRDRGDRQKYYVGEIPDGFVLKKGDFLIAMTEQAAGLLGSSIIVPEDNKFLHNQRLGLVQLKPGTPWSNEFFFHAFNTRRFRRKAHDTASGVKVRHTSPTKLGNIIIGFPQSREKQDEIAMQLTGLLGETERLAEKYELKLLQISELKQAILQRAFTGEFNTPAQAINEAAE